MTQIRIGLSNISRAKPPLLTFDVEHGWRLWSSYDTKLQAGTFHQLYSDGRIDLVTIRIDGTEDRATV